MFGITTRTMYLCAKLISGYLGLLMDTAGRAESATTHRTGWDGPSAEPSGRIDILILPEIRLNAQMDVYCHSTQLAIIQFPGCVIKLLRLVPGTGQLGWAGRYRFLCTYVLWTLHYTMPSYLLVHWSQCCPRYSVHISKR